MDQITNPVDNNAPGRPLEERDAYAVDSSGPHVPTDEDGYAAGSESWAGIHRTTGSCSSPSEDSSEDNNNDSNNNRVMRGHSNDPHRPMLRQRHHSTHSQSSDIADYSDSYDFEEERQSENTSITSLGNEEDEEERNNNLWDGPTGFVPEMQMDGPLRQCAQEAFDIRQAFDECTNGIPTKKLSFMRDPVVTANVPPTSSEPLEEWSFEDCKPAAQPLLSPSAIARNKPPIMSLGYDAMANIVGFLEPPETLTVLTTPLSRDWVDTYSKQPELWRTLCLSDPFRAQVEDDSDSESSSDEESFPFMHEASAKRKFGKYRLLYTSFVRCMRYLVRIKDDAINGRPLTMANFSPVSGARLNTDSIAANQNLQRFLSQARSSLPPPAAVVRQVANHGPVGLSDEESLASLAPAAASLEQREKRKHLKTKEQSTKKKVKFGHSKLTQRLLGPTKAGPVGDVELPWSCAIYSIVNWMVSFADVEGIQTMCLKVLPHLLENEQQRITAQRVGLTDIVLRGMVLFPESASLHTAAFHTIVLLARPLGGQEGMLFHTSMVDSTGIFGPMGGPGNGKSGIAVLLDSMRRFRFDEVLQAMGCWSLVNIALAPAQKECLVKLGGIEVTMEAMVAHSANAEVQFRALFALINLVIPPTTQSDAETDSSDGESSLGDAMDVDSIVSLVVSSMKRFCSNEAILNRACLVLHNLSLTPRYHMAMLWTPSCYQMLEWCLANYRTDQVLQQSTAGTIARLQTTLSGNESLRARFTASLQAQRQQSMQNAQQQATLLRRQQEQ